MIALCSPSATTCFEMERFRDLHCLDAEIHCRTAVVVRIPCEANYVGGLHLLHLLSAVSCSVALLSVKSLKIAALFTLWLVVKVQGDLMSSHKPPPSHENGSIAAQDEGRKYHVKREEWRTAKNAATCVICLCHDKNLAWEGSAELQFVLDGVDGVRNTTGIEMKGFFQEDVLNSMRLFNSQELSQDPT